MKSLKNILFLVVVLSLSNCKESNYFGDSLNEQLEYLERDLNSKYKMHLKELNTVDLDTITLDNFENYKLPQFNSIEELELYKDSGLYGIETKSIFRNKVIDYFKKKNIKIDSLLLIDKSFDNNGFQDLRSFCFVNTDKILVFRYKRNNNTLKRTIKSYDINSLLESKNNAFNDIKTLHKNLYIKGDINCKTLNATFDDGYYDLLFLNKKNRKDYSLTSYYENVSEVTEYTNNFNIKETKYCMNSVLTSPKLKSYSKKEY
jgi:hypothetical protein